MRANTKIIFEMFDTDSKQKSKPFCAQSVTDINTLKNKKADTSNYATTEPDGFYLDGSYKILQDVLPAGLYSDAMSDEDGSLTENVVLSVAFDTVVSSNGITLYFPFNDYPALIGIRWYKDTNLLKEGLFSPDSSTYFCRGKVENYNKIEITFYSTSIPGHYIKLCGIDYGQAIVFAGDKIIKSSANQEIDLMCDEIAINTLEFSVEDKEGLFSVVSDNSVFFAAQENQKITVYTSVGGQEKSVGTFYLDSITGSGITANFKAYDIIGVLESEDKVGDRYYNLTFEEYCSQILQGYDYSIADRLKDSTVKGYLPLCSRREALQQACFATGAIVDTQGGETIKMYPLETRPSQLIRRNQIYAGGQVENIKPQKKISVIAHNFDESGKDTPSTVSKFLNPRAKNTISVENAVFVNADNIENVLNRLEYYYNQQVLYKVSLPLENYLSLGDVFMAYLQKSYIKGNLQSMETNLSGGLTAQIVIRGYVFGYTNSLYLGETYAGERRVADVAAANI